ncbi:hypothetical protein [Pontimicrobium sp. SW4]|uniref:ABC transporter permease n=1 Tax=Pontimicrobium sp. SW4 TaxID=3153519 RepID=A0AAU7BVL7_9FLAO
MKQQFSIQRIRDFIYRDIILLRGSLITAFSVAAAFFFIAIWVNLRYDYIITPNEFANIFGIIFIPIGLYLTLSIFREANNKQLNLFYFSLPISPKEKLLATWFATSILYVVIFSIFAQIIGQIAIVTGSMMSKVELHMLPFFSNSYWSVIKFYLVIQPLFLLGSIAFNKNRLGKTLFWILILVISLAVLNGIMCFAVNDGAVDMFSSEQLTSNAFDLALNDFSTIGTWFWVIILGPVMLIAAYFKLTEKEV